MRVASLFIAFITGTIFTSFIVVAWTGPTSPPPGGNIAAPLNTGTIDQIKDAGLFLNALGVDGNAILFGASRYLSFGTLPGADGYGIRNNDGTMEFKNSGGNWNSFAWLPTCPAGNTLVSNGASWACSSPAPPPQTPITVFLTATGSNTWTVPDDWNSSDNTIEVIGGGGGGDTPTADATNQGEGGGGGAYSAATNVTLTPGSTITYAVGAGGGVSANGGDTFLCNVLNSSGSCDAITDAAVQVGAKRGTGASGTTAGLGGAAASGKPASGGVRNSGGNGGSKTGTAHGGTGGGGAGGPHGNGAAGGAATCGSFCFGGSGGGGANNGSVGGSPTNSNIQGGAGGNGRGSTGGGTVGNPNGGNGSNGGGGGGAGGDPAGMGGNGGQDALWTQTSNGATAGPGGGGGGGSIPPPVAMARSALAFIMQVVFADVADAAANDGGSASSYGGGGGGASNDPGTAGAGAQGIIVITYVP
jgi:hypothetical protein